MIRSLKHLAFIRTLQCCRCNRQPVEAAHIRMGTDGGMGLKPSDSHTVPLCHECHAKQHNIGEKAFWGDVERARDLARRLYFATGNKAAGVFAIFKFQRER